MKDVAAARHLVQHVLELLLRSRALDHRLLLREARDDPHHALLLGGARGELLLAAPLVHDLRHRPPLPSYRACGVLHQHHVAERWDRAWLILSWGYPQYGIGGVPTPKSKC